MFVLLVSHDVPIQPGLHEEQDPFCMWHISFLQLVGQGMLQFLPYTPDLLHPYNQNRVKLQKNKVKVN